ncbi:MAG: beta-N-acetylhexosaminidase [Myxococcota bacterium]
MPRPNAVVMGRGEFRLSAKTVVVATGDAVVEAEKLAATLRRATGYALTVQAEAPAGAAAIAMRIDSTRAQELGPEGYQLVVTPRGVVMAAATSAGLFYGGQTLRQLLPPEINGANLVRRSWRAPSVDISDRPRFELRGALVDPARHFIALTDLKKLIDGFAFHKLNRVHIHFTDDQGWRLPIEPTDAELTQHALTRAEFDNLIRIGSRRRETMVGRAATTFDGVQRFDGVPHGGSYTRAEIAELVAYTRERHIEIIPEVEMPGHVGAAIAANPGLGNYPERQLEVNRAWGVHEATLRPTERNIAFMRLVIIKVMQMFPDSRLIHIGGDEAPKTEWVATNAVAKKRDELRRAGRLEAVLREGPLDNEEHLQAYLVREMAKLVVANGRTLAAWDEVLDAEVPLPKDKIAVWSWRDIRRGVAAAQAGHPVVMMPTDRTYLDAPPTEDPNEPIGQPAVKTVEQAYAWNRDPDPVPDDLPQEATRNLLGTIAAFWGEHAYDFDTLQYFVFTRLPAFAEAAWTDERLTEAPTALAELKRSLTVHERRFDALGLRYRRPAQPRMRVRDLPN